MDGNLVLPSDSALLMAPINIPDTGLNRPNLLRLILKHCHLRGVETAAEMAESVGLRFGITSELLTEAKDKQLVEIRGSSGTGYSDFIYVLTGKGRDWTDSALRHNQYVGRAPVTLDDYCTQVARQRLRSEVVTLEEIVENLADLVLPPQLISTSFDHQARQETTEIL